MNVYDVFKRETIEDGTVYAMIVDAQAAAVFADASRNLAALMLADADKLEESENIAPFLYTAHDALHAWKKLHEVTRQKEDAPKQPGVIDTVIDALLSAFDGIGE